MHEIGVGGTVRGLDLDVRSVGLAGVGRFRQRGDQTGAEGHCTELSARQLVRASRKFIQIVMFAHTDSDAFSMER